MSDLNEADLMIILEGAYQMAQIDSNVHNDEIALLEKIMEATGIDSQELAKFENSNKVEIRELSNRLSSEKAKKIFLLTLAGIALADKTVDINEQEMMDVLSEELDVGNITMERISYSNCEKLILKLLAESNISKKA